MGFQDLTEVLDPFLELPIKGKKYRVAAVDAATGLRMQAIVEIAAKVKTGEEPSPEDVASLELDDDEEREFNRRLLGDSLDEMMADGVPWVYIARASRTVFAWTVQDKAAAEQVWAASDRPEDQRPAPQDRKAPAKSKKKAGSPSSSRSPRTPDSPGAASSPTGD